MLQNKITKFPNIIVNFFTFFFHVMMMTFIELDEIDLALSGFKLKIINSDTLKYLSALLLHTINRTIEKKKKTYLHINVHST